MSSDNVHTQPPTSAVSTGVGLSGLATLLVWLTICRTWPGLSEMLGLGPRQPMTGAISAFVGLTLTGGAMVAWSLLVDKVHLRPSTGIDWNTPKPLNSVLSSAITKLIGLWATWIVIAAIYAMARFYWSGRYLLAMDLLKFSAVFMVILSIPYVLWIESVLIKPRDSTWHFGAMITRQAEFEWDEVWHHARAWAVKGFFTAFMLSILPYGFGQLVALDFSNLWNNPINIAKALIALMFVIDVYIGMVGYLLTMKPLDSHIRTANPFLSGWLAALLCYPPFIIMNTGGLLDYKIATSDWTYWLAGNTPLLWVWAGLLVSLTWIYAWATVAFGIRFSNLTDRGVITVGPYRYSKHPAYIAKNLFWWCSVMPFLVTNGSWSDAVRNCFFLGLVNAIYFWRAKTEEAHLMPNPDYRRYAAWISQNGLLARALRQRQTRTPAEPQMQPQTP